MQQGDVIRSSRDTIDTILQISNSIDYPDSILVQHNYYLFEKLDHLLNQILLYVEYGLN